MVANPLSGISRKLSSSQTYWGLISGAYKRTVDPAQAAIRVFLGLGRARWDYEPGDRGDGWGHLVPRARRLKGRTFE